MQAPDQPDEDVLGAEGEEASEAEALSELRELTHLTGARSKAQIHYIVPGSDQTYCGKQLSLRTRLTEWSDQATCRNCGRRMERWMKDQTSQKAIVLVRLIFRRAAQCLRSCGLEHQARAMERAKVDPRQRFSCAGRAVLGVDTTARMAWGRQLMSPNARIAMAVEAVALARLSLDVAATDTSSRRTAQWLYVLAERASELACSLSKSDQTG